MGFFKSVTDGLKENLTSQIKDLSEKVSPQRDTKIKAEETNPITQPEEKVVKPLMETYGIKNLLVEEKNGKFAVVNKTGWITKNKTDYEYDEAVGMSNYHIRTAKLQPDGSFLYGVVTNSSKFCVIGCDYKEINFFDGPNLLMIDADGEEFVVLRSGIIKSKSRYIKDLREDLKDINDD